MSSIDATRSRAAVVSRRNALSAFASAIALAMSGRRSLAEGALQFGYAAITWGGRDREAIDDIADVGFRGIQLRTAAVDTFGDRPSELRGLLQQHRLTLVALSSGTVSVEGDAAPQIERHMKHARFLRDAGGQYLQIIDQRPSRPLTPLDFTTLARLLNELGAVPPTWVFLSSITLI